MTTIPTGCVGVSVTHQGLSAIHNLIEGGLVAG